MTLDKDLWKFITLLVERISNLEKKVKELENLISKPIITAKISCDDNKT